MMKIRILIAEDERLAREELHYLLSQEEDVELLPSAANGKELLRLAEELEPDVIFLDIQMPEMIGIQAARMLSARKQPPLLVFSTAHDNYAVEAFGLNAVDYLLKPYDHNRLRETLQRIRSRLTDAVPAGKQTAERSFPSARDGAGRLGKLLIDDQDRLVVIDPRSITYAVREDRNIQIYTATRRYTSKMSLQQLEEKLAPYPFFRTHRSYLVNLNFALELIPWFNGAYNLVLNDENRTQVPVSRSYAKELIQRLQGA